MELARWRHHRAATEGDFYMLGWKRWLKLLTPDEWVDVVTGGFACVALSSAGKQLMQADPRSGQLCDTIGMAVYFRARAILLENVVELLDKDESHGLLTGADRMAAEERYIRVFVWRLRHSDQGGASQRSRVMPLWLQEEIVLALAPVQDTTGGVPAGNIRS